MERAETSTGLGEKMEQTTFWMSLEWRTGGGVERTV